MLRCWPGGSRRLSLIKKTVATDSLKNIALAGQSVRSTPPGEVAGMSRCASADAAARLAAVASMLADGPAVLPSMLLCDFGDLNREVDRLQAGGARGLHLDVMDGRFVPQLTYGPVVVEAICRAATVPVDVHLMIEEPTATLHAYIAAGADLITLHAEAVADPRGPLEQLRKAGVLGLLAISPGTPVSVLEPLLSGSDRELCDGVLVMSVEPGFGGQAFLPHALEKLAALTAFREHRSRPLRLGVDGGISLSTIGPAAAAGAEMIVAGSAVLRSKDYARAILELEQTARDVA